MSRFIMVHCVRKRYDRVYCCVNNSLSFCYNATTLI